MRVWENEWTSGFVSEWVSGWKCAWVDRLANEKVNLSDSADWKRGFGMPTPGCAFTRISGTQGEPQCLITPKTAHYLGKVCACTSGEFKWIWGEKMRRGCEVLGVTRVGGRPNPWRRRTVEGLWGLQETVPTTHRCWCKHMLIFFMCMHIYTFVMSWAKDVAILCIGFCCLHGRANGKGGSNGPRSIFRLQHKKC